MNQVRGEC